MNILNKISIPLQRSELFEQLIIAMQREGYGILTDVNVQKALKKRLNIDIPGTRIIGTNNPPNIAKELFETDYRVGIFLPFSILLREMENNETEVCFIDAVELLKPLNNPNIEIIAKKVNKSFLNIIDLLSKSCIDITIETENKYSPFNTTISRVNTHSVKWDKYKYIDILPMWVADMDFPVALPIQEAVKDRLSHPIYGYTSTPNELNSQIVHTLQNDYGWSIKTEWLVWLPRLLTGVAASCKAFSSEGDEILICPPVFHDFFSLVKKANRKQNIVPLVLIHNRWTLDLEGIQNAITKNTKIILLCSPNNPTGTVFTDIELKKLGDICKPKNITIVSDEIHCALILDPKAKHIPTTIACPEYQSNIVTLMSPSKTFNLGGMNCAFAVIPDEEKRKLFYSVCDGFGIMPMANALPYRAALAAYRDSSEWHNQLLDHLRTNYNLLVSFIKKYDILKMTPLEATYLAWIDISRLSLDNPQQYFERYGVGLSSGKPFGDDHYIRINFACSQNMLEEAIHRMSTAIESRIRNKHYDTKKDEDLNFLIF